MVERYSYRGHDIRIELFEAKPGYYRWKWTIDGTHKGSSRNVLLAESVARSEAFLYAQVMVARLKSPASPSADRPNRFETTAETGQAFGRAVS